MSLKSKLPTSTLFSLQHPLNPLSFALLFWLQVIHGSVLSFNILTCECTGECFCVCVHMLAGTQGFESWWGFVVCFWAHSGVYVCICVGECVHIHLCSGVGECEHVPKHMQIRVDTGNLASLHHVHARVYGCSGVSSAPNRRERSLKSGLCPPLRGALPVPGTVFGHAAGLNKHRWNGKWCGEDFHLLGNLCS